MKFHENPAAGGGGGVSLWFMQTNRQARRRAQSLYVIALRKRLKWAKTESE